MQIGKLTTRAEVWSMGLDVMPSLVGKVWLDLRAREADVAPQRGLRGNGMVYAWARYQSLLQAGRYLVVGQRLYLVDAALDTDARQHAMRLSLTELIGEPATLHAKLGADRPIRIHVSSESPMPGQFQRSAYRLRAEVSIFEAGRPQAGDEISIGAQRYSVVSPVDDGDDGIVRALWVKRT